MFKFASEDLDFAHKLDVSAEPSPDYSKHYHDFFEILYFVKGNADFTVEDMSCKLHPGDIVFIQPGEHHYVTFYPDEEYERYVLKFNESIIPASMFTRLGNRPTFFNATDEMRRLFAGLDGIHARFEREDLILMFTCRLLELMTLLCLEPAADKQARRDASITKIIGYINEHIREPLTLKSICEHFFYSQSYISNKFSEHMKVSLIQYVRAKKIMAAYKLIQKGEKPTKVAEELGFADYSTFYRTYVRVMGFPPSAPQAMQKHDLSVGNG